MNGYAATSGSPLDRELIKADLPTLGDPATTIQGSVESIEGSFLSISRASPSHSISGEICSIIEENLPYADLLAW